MARTNCGSTIKKSRVGWPNRGEGRNTDYGTLFSDNWRHRKGRPTKAIREEKGRVGGKKSRKSTGARPNNNVRDLNRKRKK